MKCKEGYEGPMCSICSGGHFASLRDCVPCKEAHIGALVGFIVAATVVVSGVAYVMYKYHHYFRGLLAHIKVAVSFVTIVATIDTQV